VTFGYCAGDYYTHKAKTWALETAKQAEHVIRSYLNPAFEKLPVAAIDHLQIADMIKPIWESKPPTALNVRMHLEAILDRAKAKGYRVGDNPASLKGPLGVLLHDTRETHTVRHHPFVPYREIGAFMARLRAYRAQNQAGGVSVPGKLLEFIILTACRMSEAQFARWDEIDFEAKLWKCPWQRIKVGKKTKRDHIVPLSAPALAVLAEMQARQREQGIDDPQGFIFAHSTPSDEKQLQKRMARGGRGLLAGKPLGSSAPLYFLRKAMKRPDITVHGFRTTFQSWAVEVARADDIVHEMALGHVVGGPMFQKYGGRDTNLIEPRKQLMDAWAEYCGRTEPLDAKVIPLDRSARMATK
jgi:integrase